MFVWTEGMLVCDFSLFSYLDKFALQLSSFPYQFYCTNTKSNKVYDAPPPPRFNIIYYRVVPTILDQEETDTCHFNMPIEFFSPLDVALVCVISICLSSSSRSLM